MRYDDTPEYVKNIKLPRVRKYDKIDHLVHAKMVQLFLEKGLKEFGKEGRKAIIKEIQQHHNMETYLPRYVHDLTSDERREALLLLMHLKKKRNGKMKARSWANGWTQQKIFTKDEVASPTLSIESVLPPLPLAYLRIGCCDC